MKKLFLLAFAAFALAACSDDKVETHEKPVTGIELDRDNAEIFTGSTLQLVAAITPSDATGQVAWSSDNESVATVSETGLVEALSVGTAVIEAKCGNFSDKCTILVSNKEVAATGIELDRDDAELLPGRTLQLVATVTPSDATDPVVWSSDKESVATVSEAGLVEALSAGTAVIEARCGDFSAKCSLRVNELISFESGEKMMGIDGEGVALGTISIVSGSKTDTYSNVYWAKEYTVANDMHDKWDQLYFALPFFSTADGTIWFSSYYCDCTIYGMQMDAWGGFVLSSNVNKTVDASKAGMANQFEAYADGGADGSETFAVCYDVKSTGMAMGPDYNQPQIDFQDGAREVRSVALANSTWTYNYFGGSVKDSYVVKVTGKLNDAEVGSVECPLVSGAEKVDTWKTFDLSSLGEVDCLVFSVVSSDQIAPYYFCVDNLILK